MLIHCFGNSPFDKNELCNEIVQKVGRLPLTLKTIGSYLQNKKLDVRNEPLKRLDEVEQDFFDIILSRSHKNLHQLGVGGFKVATSRLKGCNNLH